MYLKLIAGLVFAFICKQCQAATDSYDLLTGGDCGRTSQNVAGGIVRSHQPFDTLPPIANDFVCFFQMRTMRFNQRMRFMFTHFSLTPNDCSMTNLTFFDGSMDTDPEIALVCPDSPDVLTREFVSSGNFLTIKLQVSSDSMAQRSANFSGFYVSYTQNRNPCVDPSLELMCDSGRCIFQELQCDGLNSCGDGTDERTTSPSFCDGDNTPSNLTTAATVATVPPGLFSDLTPLYIILTIAFAMLAAYVVYILLSFQWFKTFMLGCLHRCFLFAISKRRKWREEEEKSSKKHQGKVTPAPDDNLSSANKNPVDSGNAPPVFTTATLKSPQSN